MSINFTAPLNQTGYGLTGLNLLEAFEQEGYLPALWPIGDLEVPERFVATTRQALDRRALFAPQALSLRLWHQFDLAQHVGRGLRAALPIFELDRFTEVEKHHLMAQDLVFALSTWAGDVLYDAGVPGDRIRYTTLGVDSCVFHPQVQPAALEWPLLRPETTVFLNCGKWELRKGHDVLAEAFAKAFAPEDNVLLILNCHNPCFRTREEMERYNDQWTKYHMSTSLGRAGRVMILGNRLRSQEDVAALMARADVGVFPSRAEGWNLEAGEMLAMGKSVVITKYSGHIEYANVRNAQLIEIDTLEEAFDGIWFHGQGNWAHFGDRQMEQLITHLRVLHRRKQEGVSLFNQAGVDTMRDYTWRNAALAIVEET